MTKGIIGFLGDLPISTSIITGRILCKNEDESSNYCQLVKIINIIFMLFILLCVLYIVYLLFSNKTGRNLRGSKLFGGRGSGSCR